MIKKILFIAVLVFLPQAAFAGSQTYSRPGTYTFTVPAYSSLSVTVKGAGGSGADGNVWSYGPQEYYPDSWYGSDGFNGGYSTFGNVRGNGGEKGYGYFGHYRNGAGGIASGGSSNTTGAGGAGGAGGQYALNGTYDGEYRYSASGSGGNGGRAIKSYASGQLIPGNTVTVKVGAGGAGGTAKQTKATMEQPNHDEGATPVPGQGAAGKNGSVVITWTDALPTVTTNAATGITQTSATLQGTGDPNGLSATGYFRYSTTNPGTCNNTSGTRSPSPGGVALGSGSVGVNYPSSLSGLTADTTYYFCAIATNAGGTGFGTVRSFKTFTVTNPAPAFSASPTSGTSPLAVRFTASNLDKTTWSTTGYYSVNFGDGTTGSMSADPLCLGCSSNLNYSVSALHTYTSAGTYKATLWHPAPAGTRQPDTLVGTLTITVTTNPAITSISPTSGPTGTVITITGSGFTATGNTVHFGAGGKLNVKSSNGTSMSYTIPSSVSGCNLWTGSSSCTQVETLATPGAYAIYVTNAKGTSNSKTFTVTVVNTAPNAPTVTVPSGQIVNVAGSYTFRASDSDGDTVRYGIDWDNNGTTDEWLPASGYVASNTVKSTNHTWTSSGTKTFTARTQDSEGAYSAWVTETVSIGSPAPTAVLTAERGTDPVSSYREGDAAFTLRWSSSNATSCTGTNFSTGTGNPASGTATISSISADRTYTVTCSGSTNPPGTDAVTVTFTDNGGPLTGSMSISGPTTGVEDVSYTFTFTATDPESDTIRYGIDWDPSTDIDEWVPTSGYVASGASRDSSTSWSTPGIKTFRALAEDSRGAQSGWKTHTITLSAACIPSNVCADDGNVRNSCTDELVQSCSFGCELSACLPPPDPAPSDGGEFTAVPGIVQEGATSDLSWNIADTESCTVTENNPDIDDTWTGTAGEHTTSALFQRTTYTLVCDGLDEDSIEDDYTASVVVIVVPVFIEK